MTDFELVSVTDSDRWRSILPANRSVFGSLEYCRIAEMAGAGVPRLFAHRSPEGSSAYPFFSRPIGSLPFAIGEVDLSDTSTPDYTGPIPLEVSAGWQVSELQRAFAAWAADSGVVAEFAHLNPFTSQLDGSDFLRFDRDIVWIDLRKPLERMWEEDFSHACRKNIKRAQKEEVRVYQGTTVSDVEQFHRVYIATMRRNQARSQYFFPLSFFMRFREDLPSNSTFLMAEQQGRVIAATLYLHDDANVYSYLGGADHEAQSSRPTNAIVYEAIRLNQEAGRSRMILGGGYRGEDGIFTFKSSFSPLRARFFTYRRVHNALKYNTLNAAWQHFYGAQLPETFFPAYRYIPPAP
jgi:serine/alanine adding enzyme